MKENDIQLLQKVLKDAGFSMTKARQYVCELLWGKEPQSMHELAGKLNGVIDRASLYRTIGLFERLGIAQRIYIGWKYKVELSDIFSHHHHHISCISCGKIVVIKEEDELESQLQAIAERYNFEAQGHQLEIQGLCSSCRPQ